ncbi:ent-copalyl diphosphate synthase chloroplastic-like [Tripterygium wilfordii]|uniref:Ent-copalyl diphosphate synthase chloroplastic-like n=1 Tax=Tripterygium wilfordii TaxID=458696 RepID=A0A7J7BT13_TRIWF|nr:ent-copalyl diphosphate synthase chloroplastic-like [Tripterygium wilfordii]
MSMLEKENEEHFLGGFEIVFPSILEMARKLGIQLPDDHHTCSALQNIIFKRNLKLTRCWTEDGISWSSNFRLHDIDDTSMGFYLLRLYGYEVSPGKTYAFGYSTEGKEFRCYLGQWNEAISVMFNLYRASQMLFSGEKILQEAKKFASKFLSRKREANRFLDKWIILKDLAGEIGLALDVPWYASLPRVQARFYVDQYGAGDVVHIGKTLFREPFIDNDMYLHLAKLDYNYCQSLHQIEWNNIQKY